MITKKELLERLKRSKIDLGCNPDRMLTYFTSLGLIDKPVRFGLGKGKGIVSKYDDKVFNDIKAIVKLRKEGFTYEKIRYKKLGDDDYLSLILQIKRSSKSEEDAINSIKKIPFISDHDKGAWKLISDILDHLTGLILDDLAFYFGPVVTEEFREWFSQYIYNSSLAGPITDLLTNLGFEDDSVDYENYLHGKMDWKILLHSKWPLPERSKEGQKNRKSKKGGNHDNHDKK